MDQWQQYSGAGGNSRRQNNNSQSGLPQQPRELGSNAAQPTYGGYNQYRSAARPTSQDHSLAASPTYSAQQRDGSGDIAMQDAGDAHSGLKYPMRPHHQQHLSASGRAGINQPPQEQSTAAQRYSPMEALSGSGAYAPPSAQAAQNRQSPTRPGSYSSPASYYGARASAQQLPPITPYSSVNNQETYPQSATTQFNALFGNDTKSPRRPAPQQGPPASGRGPVPHFKKVRSPADLRPKVNAQPAFRRANPEGGFISVSKWCS